MSSDRPLWYAGADIGGTKAEFAFRPSESRDATVLRFGGVNLTVSGAEAAARLIGEAVSTIRTNGKVGGFGALVLGIAGGGDPRLRDRLESILKKTIPDCQFAVMSDADIALYAAFRDTSGVLVIAGTGSGVIVRDRDGRLTRAGGHGPALGDPGSGTNLGRSALAAVADHLDGGPDTILRKSMEQYHTPDETRAWLRDPSIPVAQLAPLVLLAAENHDDVAIQIVERETRALSKQASWAVGAARVEVESRIAFVGGLTHNPFYMDHLRMALIEHLPGFRFVKTETPPSVAALKLAEAG